MGARFLTMERSERIGMVSPCSEHRVAALARGYSARDAAQAARCRRNRGDMLPASGPAVSARLSKRAISVGGQTRGILDQAFRSRRIPVDVVANARTRAGRRFT